VDAGKEHLSQIHVDVTIERALNPQSAHFGIFKCDTVLPIFRAFETAPFGRLRAKRGQTAAGRRSSIFGETRRGELQTTRAGAFQSPFGRLPPEEGIVVGQEVESPVNNEYLTRDDWLDM
jgi:hypothetical protein